MAEAEEYSEPVIAGYTGEYYSSSTASKKPKGKGRLRKWIDKKRREGQQRKEEKRRVADEEEMLMAEAKRRGRYSYAMDEAKAKVAEKRRPRSFEEERTRAVEKGLFLGRGLGWIIKKVLLVAIFIFVFGVCALAIIFIIRVTGTGAADYYFEHGTLYAKETGLPVLAKTGFLGIWDLIWNPHKPGLESSFSIVDEKDAVKRYVKLESPVPQKNTYQSGERNILVYIKGTVFNLEKDTRGVINCDLKDYKDEQKILIKPDKELSLRGGGEDSFSASCLFEEGLILKGLFHSGVDAIPGSVTFSYDNVAESEWRAWVTSEENKKKKDIVKQIDDPYLSGGGKRKSVPRGDTPMKIGIDIFDEQPYVSGEMYMLSVLLTKDDLSGNLGELKELYLFIPPGITLTDDVRYCEFEATSEAGKYRLRDKSRDYYNKDCSKKGLVGLGISSDECVRMYKDEILATCMITFDISSSGDVPTFVDFKAKAEYTYEVKKSFIVNVVPSKDERIVCGEYKTEGECSVKGCMFSNGVCKACPSNWVDCSDYSAEQCGNDVCHFNCEFKDNTCVVKT